MKNRFNRDINTTDLLSEEWDLPKQPTRVVVHPWDLETDLAPTSVWQGDVILKSPSPDDSLTDALGNLAAWNAFTNDVPFGIKDEPPTL